VPLPRPAPCPTVLDVLGDGSHPPYTCRSFETIVDHGFTGLLELPGRATLTGGLATSWRTQEVSEARRKSRAPSEYQALRGRGHVDVDTARDLYVRSSV
jgi:hypothetical protein